MRITHPFSTPPAKLAGTPVFDKTEKDGAPGFGCDEWLVAGRRCGAGDGSCPGWWDGIDGGATVAGGIDGANAEDDVVFGEGDCDGGDVAGGDDVGPVGLV